MQYERKGNSKLSSEVKFKSLTFSEDGFITLIAKEKSPVFSQKQT